MIPAKWLVSTRRTLSPSTDEPDLHFRNRAVVDPCVDQLPWRHLPLTRSWPLGRTLSCRRQDLGLHAIAAVPCSLGGELGNRHRPCSCPFAASSSSWALPPQERWSLRGNRRSRHAVRRGVPAISQCAVYMPAAEQPGFTSVVAPGAISPDWMPTSGTEKLCTAVPGVVIRNVPPSAGSEIICRQVIENSARVTSTLLGNGPTHWRPTRLASRMWQALGPPQQRRTRKPTQDELLFSCHDRHGADSTKKHRLEAAGFSEYDESPNPSTVVRQDQVLA